MGSSQPLGTERVSPNGYRYKKIGDGQWELVQRLLAEQKLGRKLHANEYVRLQPGADKANPQMKDIIIRTHGTSGLRKKIAELEASIKDKQDELAYCKEQLRKKEAGIVG
jgi:oligoribonuclease (3'-5' exoribonuclease)